MLVKVSRLAIPHCCNTKNEQVLQSRDFNKFIFYNEITSV